MDLYFISGLGADKRVFRNLMLPAQHVIHHIEWLSPGKSESLGEYCLRLLDQVDTRRPFVLIGLSFGGIVAIEMSKHCRPEKIILISSISGPAELSPGMKRAGKFKLHRLIPNRLLLKPNRLLYRLFGLNTEEEKELLRAILAGTDPVFFRWALNRMSSWNNTFRPQSFLHIHGTDDHILPFHESMEAIKVIGGGHLMVYNHSAIISTLLADNLADDTGIVH